jgi:hypothetical protein
MGKVAVQAAEGMTTTGAGVGGRVPCLDLHNKGTIEATAIEPQPRG